MDAVQTHSRLKKSIAWGRVSSFSASCTTPSTGDLVVSNVVIRRRRGPSYQRHRRPRRKRVPRPFPPGSCSVPNDSIPRGTRHALREIVHMEDTHLHVWAEQIEHGCVQCIEFLWPVQAELPDLPERFKEDGCLRRSAVSSGSSTTCGGCAPRPRCPCGASGRQRRRCWRACAGRWHGSSGTQRGCGWTS